MTTLVLNSWKTAREIKGASRFPWQLGVLAVAIALVLSEGPAGDAARQALADAFLTVVPLVALAVAFGMALTRRLPMAGRLALPAWPIPLAALVLLVPFPRAAAVVLALGVAAGLGGAFLSHLSAATAPRTDRPLERPWPGVVVALWAVMLLGGLALTLASALGFAVGEGGRFGLSSLGLPMAFAIFGALAVLALWAIGPILGDRRPSVRPVPPLAPLARLMDDTNTLGAWVIAAFVTTQVALALGHPALADWLVFAAPLLPLIGVAFGLLPGVGPQILVATLVVGGGTPVSMLIATVLAAGLSVGAPSTTTARLVPLGLGLLGGYGAYALGW
ncbi:putative manganese transporter [Rhodospirillum rubrum]|uniref:Uncharacterized protein n=1 Tax=Rhodospirillum rubrum (strain ATCC 11170 / ATH 1.1.1 / DSM 467 / LMG 4362 / NCIMB 8255 / S1) TaxID=269796 RepID=Q2RPI6_RHORT|nr:putative manganese transporter [Rhodospirillum rubrum]ABC23959.1 hypothetical protein Rru_A3164 [Rhodospirillum rubrum ATCC 11170]AEO49704.1 hypothetical protein F11_16210 [Rhodospirillum rubrum F11]MBK5955640.1 hypothetical protein [Rhodospirillum rubrum]QXG79902.1 putative manganese transporter [Rhodospirillum rubrum]HAP99818.1 hypothetical protein [Rhodospirillum rubrum]